MAANRNARRKQLQNLLAEDPFLTDQQLAELLEVSVATIRLDRMALSIPELRERTKTIASKNYSKLKALEGTEVIGEIIDLELGKFAISILSVQDDMVFERTQILRGHHLFAQANSLAVALVNANVALTAKANVRYYIPVKNGDRVIAKAALVSEKGSRSEIIVESKVNQEMVFRGEFTVVALEKESDSN
ncbi:MAG: transcription factor FapR [Firmicutes bacterium]|nr:transcription factor FapR [Bacillota bacterium]